MKPVDDIFRHEPTALFVKTFNDHVVVNAQNPWRTDLEWGLLAVNPEQGLDPLAPLVPLDPGLSRGLGIFLRNTCFNWKTGAVRSFDRTIMTGTDSPLPNSRYEGILRLVLTPENEQAREFLQYFGGGGRL